MNGPRLLLQASCAGLYGGFFVAIVLRILHPRPGLGDWTVAMAPVVAVYALAAGCVWTLLYGVVRFFASRRIEVSWFNLRYVMSFHAANAIPLLVSLFLTLWLGRRAIAPDAAWRLKLLEGAVALAWAYTLVICLVPPLKRRAALQASAAGLSMAALLAPVWSPGVSQPAMVQADAGAPRVRPLQRRLILLNFDGADLEDILMLEARGNLPGFSRLRRDGTFGRLDSLLPCVTMTVRAALATGRLPYRSGVPGAWHRDLLGREVGLTVVPFGIGFDALLAPFMNRKPIALAQRAGPALWEMARVAGGEGVAEGWEVDLDLVGADSLPGGAEARRMAQEFLGDDEEPPAADLPHLADLALAVEMDAGVGRVLEESAKRSGPGVIALNFPGLDRVAHRFLRYARPDDFGDVSGAEAERYGAVLERYYSRIDRLVETAVRARGEEGLLLVTSSHGMEAAGLARRLLAASLGAEIDSGTHGDAPDGFLFALGPDVGAGGSFRRAALTDVLPTALYLLHLPIARDLDGRIIEQVPRPGYTRDHPAVVIDSYGPPPVAR